MDHINFYSRFGNEACLRQAHITAADTAAERKPFVCGS